MINQKGNLFSKEALERAATPEQLDQLIQVVNFNKWLPLAAISSLVMTGIAWSIFGRIPITVLGQGILVYPSKVVSFQSPIAGKLQTINVNVGEVVDKGDVLATIDQSELIKQLELARAKRVQLQLLNQDASRVLQQRQDLDKQALQQQRQSLQQSLVAVRKVVLQKVFKDRSNPYN